jgi:hypothetical protein
MNYEGKLMLKNNPQLVYRQNRQAVIFTFVDAFGPHVQRESSKGLDRNQCRACGLRQAVDAQKQIRPCQRAFLPHSALLTSINAELVVLGQSYARLPMILQKLIAGRGGAATTRVLRRLEFSFFRPSPERASRPPRAISGRSTGHRARLRARRMQIIGRFQAAPRQPQ